MTFFSSQRRCRDANNLVLVELHCSSSSSSSTDAPNNKVAYGGNGEHRRGFFSVIPRIHGLGWKRLSRRLLQVTTRHRASVRGPKRRLPIPLREEESLSLLSS